MERRHPEGAVGDPCAVRRSPSRILGRTQETRAGPQHIAGCSRLALRSRPIGRVHRRTRPAPEERRFTCRTPRSTPSSANPRSSRTRSPPPTSHSPPASRPIPRGSRLKDAATALQSLQVKDGSVPEEGDRPEASALVDAIVESIDALAPRFPHEAAYLAASVGRLPPVAGRGVRRARLPRLARGVPAAAAPRRRHPPPRGVPDVHAERLDRPARRGARRRDDLARVHRRARGGRLLATSCS